MQIQRNQCTAPAGVDRAQQLFAQAFAYHQKNELDLASLLYQQVLQLRPDHFDALHMLGVIAAHRGDYIRAVDIFGQALQFNAQTAEVFSNYGVALGGLKQYRQALESYNRAIALQPGFSEAYCNRGRIYYERKQYTEAIADFDKAISLKPDYQEAWFSRGVGLHDLKRLHDALASYDRAIELNSDYVDAHYNRGVVLHDLKRYDDAMMAYDRVIALQPGYAAAYNNKGHIFQHFKRNPEALEGFEKAIQLNPDYAEAHYNRGFLLFKLHRQDESLDCFNRAIFLNPDYAEAYNGKGYLLHKYNRHDEAIECFEKAISLKPGYADAYANSSLSHLIRGDFEKGWPAYEWRLRRDEVLESARNFARPQWMGELPVSGKTILLHYEQGLGDTIQFCRYARMAADLGAEVILEVQPSLMRLLKDLDGVVTLVERGQQLPPFDLHCPLMSLPLAFRTDMDSIPAYSGYIAPDADNVKRWSEVLGHKKGLRVGLMWSGSLTHINDHNRSIPLQQFIRMLPAGVDLVSLQKEIRPEDLITLDAHPEILRIGEDMADFTDTAALCELVDIVLTVDTSVAHLAGAMGKPVWILLPFNPDWRWLLEREDTPWYPTAKLYRQMRTGDWDEVIEKVRADLYGMLTKF